MKAKRIVSILLTGSMLLSLLPVSALAASPVFDAPAQTTAKKAAPLVQEADASRSTEEEAATRSSRDLDAENGTADSITIQLNAEGKPESEGGSGHWKCDDATNFNLLLYDGTFTLQPSSEPGAESALQTDLDIREDAEFNGGTVGWGTNNHGTISGGTFQGGVYNSGTISGGTFQGNKGGNVDNYANISGGTFHGKVYNYGNISGGTFQENVGNYKTISGGTFRNFVYNYRTISGGTFEGPIEVYASSGNATIEGGTFEKNMALMNDGASIIISDGLFNGAVVDEGCRSPLSITGGLFTQAVNASDTDPTNLQITGGYFVSKPTVPNGSDIAFTTVSDQNGGNFQVPVNDGFSESYTSLFVPHGSSEQPNTITVKTNTKLLYYLADGERFPVLDSDSDSYIYQIPVQGYEKIVLVTEEPSAPPTDDIEQQKAARWCAEQGLLSDHGATFGPDTKVTNARIIRAWNSLKKVPVPITN